MAKERKRVDYILVRIEGLRDAASQAGPGLQECTRIVSHMGRFARQLQHELIHDASYSTEDRALIKTAMVGLRDDFHKLCTRIRDSGARELTIREDA